MGIVLVEVLHMQLKIAFKNSHLSNSLFLFFHLFLEILSLVSPESFKRDVKKYRNYVVRDWGERFTSETFSGV